MFNLLGENSFLVMSLRGVRQLTDDEAISGGRGLLRPLANGLAMTAW